MLEAEGNEGFPCCWSLTALLCSLVTLNFNQLHVSCVTEHQKYALGATKPHGAGIVPVRCPSHTVPHCNRSTVTCGILESPYKVAASNGRCVIHVRPFTILEQGTAGNIQSQGAATGLEFLATRPPWRCASALRWLPTETRCDAVRIPPSPAARCDAN